MASAKQLNFNGVTDSIEHALWNTLFGCSVSMMQFYNDFVVYGKGEHAKKSINHCEHFYLVL